MRFCGEARCVAGWGRQGGEGSVFPARLKCGGRCPRSWSVALFGAFVVVVRSVGVLQSAGEVGDLLRGSEEPWDAGVRGFLEESLCRREREGELRWWTRVGEDGLDAGLDALLGTPVSRARSAVRVIRSWVPVLRVSCVVCLEPATERG